MKKKYDIFISYRRDGSKEFARILQLELKKHGFRVFLDFDELRDGRFDNKILDAIGDASVFLLLLSEESLKRCGIDGDWVSIEIRHAIKCEKKIIPIVVNNSFTAIPEDTPSDIRCELEVLQYSFVDTDNLLHESVSKMVDERIRPSVKPKRGYMKWVLLGVVAICCVAAVLFCTSKRYSVEPDNNRDIGDTIFMRSYVSKETQEKIFGSLSETMVEIEGGEFRMPLTYEEDDSIARKHDAENNRLVRVNTFRLSKYEVTQELWMAVMGQNPSMFVGAKHPVEMVTYKDCQYFVEKLNKLTHKKYRIPTEEEWAFAAQGGNRSRNYIFSGGNNLDEVAWNTSNSDEQTHPVGQKKPNELGLYDMCGNVWEWTNSRREANDEQIGIYIIRRGGSWTCDENCCRYTTRDFKPSDYKSQAIGLRLAE